MKAEWEKITEEKTELPSPWDVGESLFQALSGAEGGMIRIDGPCVQQALAEGLKAGFGRTSLEHHACQKYIMEKNADGTFRVQDPLGNIFLPSASEEVAAKILAAVNEQQSLASVEHFLNQCFDEVKNIISRLRTTRREARSLKERLGDDLVQIAKNIPSDDLVKKLATRIYWTFPDIPATAVAKMLGPEVQTGSLLTMLGPWLSPLPCTECGKEFALTSRSQAMELIATGSLSSRYANRPTCSTCSKFLEEKERQRFFQPIHAQERQQVERLAVLRSMPYDEYLNTPEWDAKRKAAYRRAFHKCQVCNAGNKKLNTHHRTYVNRGAERPEDLIVLCNECHEIFSREGKLAKEERT